MKRIKDGVFFTLQLPAELSNAIKAMALRDERSASAQIRWIIKEAIRLENKRNEATYGDIEKHEYTTRD